MPHRIVSVLLTLVLGFVANEARGEILLTVGNGTITPDGSLSVDVFIATDTGPLSLAEFTLFLELSPTSSTGAATLDFVNPQSESFLLNDDYIFSDNSDAIENSESTITYDNQTATLITVFDFTTDAFGDPVDVDITGTPQLIATLDIKHNLNGESAAATLGDEFQFLIDESSEFLKADGFETFDPGIGPVFTVSGGMITVGAVAIPEPTSIAFLTLASIGMCVRRRRRS